MNQSTDLFDFYRNFPEYFSSNYLSEYKNLRDLQASSLLELKDKYSFLPREHEQEAH